MLKTTHILAAGALLSASLLGTTAYAKAWYPGAAPAAFHIGGTLAGANTISCYTCHSGAPQTENNVTTSFGVAFRQNENQGIVSTYTRLAPLDSDGDGFSNQQEAFVGSSMNAKLSTPLLTLPDMTKTGISAKAITGGKVSALSLQAGTPATALGGIVSFTSPYNSVTPTATTLTTTTFMFTAGGAQAVTSFTLYNANGIAITPTPTNAPYSSTIQNATNGSVNIGIADESIFDLYTTASFQQAAINKYTAFVAATAVDTYATISPYANINPYAKVSSHATVEPYATIKAYAVVDDYAVIGAYAQIGSYAYVGPNIDIYTGIDIYTRVVVDAYASVDTYVTAPAIIKAKSGVGIVKGKFSIATTPPTPRLLGIAGGAGAGTAGTSKAGLHCMTTGLGTQGLMFLSLLGVTLLIRRKLS
ncbi:MAG: hypothetical protein Q9N02_07730 [Ghiorsea sp.]|nr:hypothetical protein [Ghiorsea sp.]